MRDIELTTAPSDPADPEVDDAAYAVASPAGVMSDTTATDPAFTDAKAYMYPSLGGDFGIGRALILGAQADGGAALLDAPTTVTVTPPVVPTPQNPMPLGRSANGTTRLNLYPWLKVPPQGLDMNNPHVPPAAEDPEPEPPPTGITVTGNTLTSNTGHVAFSGPAARHATVTLDYSINGNPTQQVTVAILAGDTGSQIAAKVRNAIDAVFGLDASGTGGTVNVVGLGGVLTAFHISVS
jgi:hypothetical protein